MKSKNAMVEQIFVPTTNDITVHIPDEYLGKRVRVRVNEEVDIHAAPRAEELSDETDKLKMTFEEFKAFLKTASFNADGWKFNRDEANDYDE